MILSGICHHGSISLLIFPWSCVTTHFVVVGWWISIGPLTSQLFHIFFESHFTWKKLHTPHSDHCASPINRVFLLQSLEFLLPPKSQLSAFQHCPTSKSCCLKWNKVYLKFDDWWSFSIQKGQFWGIPLFSDQAKMVPPPHCFIIHPLSHRSAEDRAAPADGTSSGSCSNCCASGGVGGCGAGTEGYVRKMGHWGISPPNFWAILVRKDDKPL